MAINLEELRAMRDDLKGNMPQLIANGLLILISQLKPFTNDPELQLRYDILISAFIGMAIYSDLATKAPKYIIDEYFAEHGQGIVMTSGNGESYFIAYSFTGSLAFREYLAKL